MNVPTLDATDYARQFAPQAGPDGAGATGQSNSFPAALEISGEQFRSALNPLHYVPVVGMIYRATTGETVPATMRVAGAGLIGGPLGMLGAGLMGLLEALLSLGPDTSRAPAPAGMSNTGSEAGVEPVTPGTLGEGAYTTLATTVPEFLSAPNTALVQNGAAAYQSAALEYQRSQMAEKGLA